MSHTRTILCAGKYLQLAREGTYEYAHRANATGAVVIGAVNERREILIVDEYRVAVHAQVISLPAGVVGDEPEFAQESPEEAARRELEEETGWRAHQLTLMTEGPPSAGMSSEIITFFLATSLTQGHRKEDIPCEWVELSKIDSYLDRKRTEGAMIDPKLYTVLYWVKKLLAI